MSTIICFVDNSFIYPSMLLSVSVKMSTKIQKYSVIQSENHSDDLSVVHSRVFNPRLIWYRLVENVFHNKTEMANKRTELDDANWKFFLKKLFKNLLETQELIEVKEDLLPARHVIVYFPYFLIISLPFLFFPILFYSTVCEMCYWNIDLFIFWCFSLLGLLEGIKS